MLGMAWSLTKSSVLEFIADDALSWGAAMAFYAATSIGPVLLIVVAIAGLAFGEDAARGAVMAQLAGLMGAESAAVVQSVIASAWRQHSGVIASVIGGCTLLLTASGVFGEMQTALNVIWKAEPQHSTVIGLVRARIASLGLVVALGFLLLISLVVSAAVTALGHYINRVLPFGSVLLEAVNFVVSLTLIALLFAAIYKTLPDRDLGWRDVMIGSVVTAVLFTVGKLLIGLYIGNTGVASSYGAAGSVIVLLFWIYYSAQIFLLGAEFTKVYASHHGSLSSEPLAELAATNAGTSSAGEPRPERIRLGPLVMALAALLLIRAMQRARPRGGLPPNLSQQWRSLLGKPRDGTKQAAAQL